MLSQSTGLATSAQEPTLQDALDVPAVGLSQGYRLMESYLDFLFAAEGGGTIQTPEGTIDKSNVQQYRERFEARLAIYRAAIEQRGYESFAGNCDASATESCSRAGSAWAGLVSAGAARGVEIVQEGFAIQLTTRFELNGEIQRIDTQPVAVESVMTFDDFSNSDYALVGEIEDDRIVINPDERVLDAWPQWADPPKSEDLRNCTVTLQVSSDGGTSRATASPAPRQNRAETEDVRALRLDATQVSQQVKLTASDADSGDFFGNAVALSGDTLVIAARRDRDEGRESGSAYVFQRDGVAWAQQAKLTPSDLDAGDWFGDAVAISGNTIAIGAPNHDDQGAVYVFQRNGTAWTQRAKLTSADASTHDRFGNSIGISGDTIIVGAWRDEATGAAYVFQRSGATWRQQARLTATDSAAEDQFGGAVAISGDTAVIGAPRDDDASTGSGSAYVFQRSGMTWVQRAKLTPRSGAADMDNFGRSVAVSQDIAVVGAFSRSGAAYVFARSGTMWALQAVLTESARASAPARSFQGISGSIRILDDAKNESVFDHFGESVSISGDTVVVGAYGAALATQGPDTGAAFVYQGSGTTWTKQARLTASDAGEHDELGISVAISGDIVVVGAQRDDDAGPNAGSAYVYQRSGVTWVQ